MKDTHNEDGFSFAELMFAAAIIAIASVILISHLAINYGHVRAQRDRVFAFMTAKSMLAEIQAFAIEGENTGLNDVDALDDGAVTSPTLTVARPAAGATKAKAVTASSVDTVLPDHELSGNSKRGNDWVWSRQVSVRPFKGMNNSKLRYVTVTVYKIDSNGDRREVANISSVVNALAQSSPPSQVFDVYLIAIENIPGWWVHMETIRPFMEAMIADLERSNPGLSIRTHWITKASYGRDELYRPYINDSVDSHQVSPGVYYYPGLMPAGNASTYYYVPGAIRARMLTESGESNGYDATFNPHPYALADFFNHGMRYPRERALHDQRMRAIQNRKDAILTAQMNGVAAPPPLWDMSEEPTYRLLLEDMASDPDRFRNALVINLHGELVPMPSIRNYSDAAKSPLTAPGVRVVTHPEELRTQRDPAGVATDDAVFRVYAYTANPDTYSGSKLLTDKQPILLQVMGAYLAEADGTLTPGVTLEALQGGVAIAGLPTSYRPFAPAKSYLSPLLPGEMHYRAYNANPGPGREKYTIISLRNTPVVAPLVKNAVSGDLQGIDKSTRARLYGMEYIPSCTGGTTDFSHDLAAAGTGPKNTARWRLRISSKVLQQSKFVTPLGKHYNPKGDVQLTVRTRIWNTTMGPWTGTGTAFPAQNDPANLSETYTWWADSREDVPVTERAQFLGDPRYNPYKDLLHKDPDFGNGYNWFFDSLQNTVDVTGDYGGLDRGRLRNRWQGYLRQDVPRYFDLLRRALVYSNSIYTTLTGWSYYYMGHGGEIGYDSANGYPNSIPAELTVFGKPGTNGYINNLTGSRKYVRRSGGSYWWGMPWLGELYPDDQYKQWLVQGNLTPGTAGGQFYQAGDQSVYAGSRNVTAGTLIAPALQRLKPTGCGMFFNIGNSSTTFNHQGNSGTGTLQGAGLELASNYNMALPASTTVNRPFSLATSNNPDGWGFDPYVTNRYSAKLLQTYYTHPLTGFTGSGLVQLTSPDGKSSAFVVVNGLAQTTTLGTRTLAKYSLLTLVHSFFESGYAGVTNRTTLPPRVDLLYPTEITEIMAPVNITLQYELTWSRWDREKYTASMAAGFSENESDIEYSLLYSRNNGFTWQHLVDNSPATPGERPKDAWLMVADSSIGPESYTWPVPSAQFPKGSYVIRVEAYRKNATLHYAYDQKKVFLDR